MRPSLTRATISWSLNWAMTALYRISSASALRIVDVRLAID
jgi:hypothetical protein